jgi:hypothetical protein
MEVTAMRTTIVTAALALTASLAGAQVSETLPLEVRPFIGASIPTGSQRDVFDDALIVGAQAALGVTERFQAIATFAWVGGTASYPVSEDGVDIYQYDFGAEFDLRGASVLEPRFTPFIGAGAGGRSYRYASNDLSDNACFSAYGAVGAELRLYTATFRVEARDNVFCYESPLGTGQSRTRNDVTLAIGLGLSIF